MNTCGFMASTLYVKLRRDWQTQVAEGMQALSVFFFASDAKWSGLYNEKILFDYLTDNLWERTSSNPARPSPCVVWRVISQTVETVPVENLT